jgi:hypothetical protein
MTIIPRSESSDDGEVISSPLVDSLLQLLFVEWQQASIVNHALAIGCSPAAQHALSGASLDCLARVARCWQIAIYGESWDSMSHVLRYSTC